jgi:hypothetical protein
VAKKIKNTTKEILERVAGPGGCVRPCTQGLGVLHGVLDDARRVLCWLHAVRKVCLVVLGHL